LQSGRIMPRRSPIPMLHSFLLSSNCNSHMHMSHSSLGTVLHASLLLVADGGHWRRDCSI
jgi:hypothetical protein